MIVVVLAGAGVGSYLMWFRDTTTTVSADYVLVDSVTAKAHCVGQGDNASVKAGLEVRLLDGNGHQIASSQLSTGDESGDRCIFHARFASVADDLSSYSLSVSGFARQTKSRSDLAAAKWTFDARKDPPAGLFSGTLELTDTETAANDCTGVGGYDDIDEGTDVVVRDQDGTILGSGSLDAGSSDDGSVCTYDFSVEDVRRDQQQYTVDIADRGELTYSRAEMTTYAWSVSVTLGT